ncbi:aspartic peptidase A1 [Flagelloscypha sp. PMI_526]|nr:aspartic peptidase A1 [Flagelloscypha sp. PMI_526]
MHTDGLGSDESHPFEHLTGVDDAISKRCSRLEEFLLVVHHRDLGAEDETLQDLEAVFETVVKDLFPTLSQGMLQVECQGFALNIPFEIHHRGPSPRLARRGTNLPLNNIGNAQYVANMTIGDANVRLLLDTGSSDLWVNFNGAAPTTTDLGKTVSLNYAIGRVSVQVTDTSSFAGDIHKQGYDASNIRDEVDSAAGDTVLQRIFEDQGASSQNYMTLLLDRTNDTTTPFTGQFTVSEPVAQFQAILNEPKLDVAEVYKFMEAEQHWQVLTDKDTGIIGPDGDVIASDSIVPKAPDGQLVAVFDSGFTFSQVSRDVADAIYGRVKSAEYDTKNERWLLPCGQLLNLTFSFGGKKFPMHPLDVVNDDFRVKNSKGEHVCIGAFQPITTAFSIFGNFDIILGMSFMRNSYTLMNYGNWLDSSNTKQQDPYIQLLSVTDAAAARKEFIDVRLTAKTPLKKKKYQEMVLSRWPYILAGCLVGVALIAGFCIWRCCCRRGAKKGKLGGGGGFLGKKGKHDSYVALQVPAGGLSSTALPGPGGYGNGHGQHHGGGYGGHQSHQGY